MTHGCEQQGGDQLWRGRGGSKGENWDTCNRTTIKVMLWVSTLMIEKEEFALVSFDIYSEKGLIWRIDLQ